MATNVAHLMFEQELDVALTLIHNMLEAYGLNGYREYLLIRKPGKPDSFIIRNLASDASDFPARLEALHREHCAREQ